MTVRVTQKTLARLRLLNQQILASGLSSPAEAVRRLTALQAQDLPGALWSVGLRVPGSRLHDVEEVLNAGSVVRSWPLRGTLHLVAAEDLAWILSLTVRSLVPGGSARQRQLAIDEKVVGRARDVIGQRLAGGQSATRAELFTALNDASIETAAQRGAHILWHLAQTGTIVMGPLNGCGQSFVLLDEWVPRPRRLEPDAALAELVLRYFSSHGPATERDCSWWSQLPPTMVRTGIEMVRTELTELVYADKSYWMPAQARDAIGVKDLRAARSIFTLPGFDEYLLGYGDRSAVLPAAYAQRIVPGGNGLFRPTIVAAGQVVGTWTKTVRGGVTVVEPAPFRELSETAARGLEKAVVHYGRFLGTKATLEPPPAVS